MTEETAIERLDYSKPPPGYEVFDDDGDREEDGFDFSCMGWYFGIAGCDDVPEDGKPRATEADALVSAWAHYKVHNDPPGMWSGKARGEHPGGYGFALMGTDPEHPLEADFEVLADARAAAWAHYKLHNDPPQDPEVGALIEEGLREAQADARVSEERVAELRRDLEQAEQRAQQNRARVRKLIGFSIEPFLAPPWLRPRDLKTAKSQIPRGSIQCAQWDDDGPDTHRVRLGLQLGEEGPGFWIDVSRQELGVHAREHDARTCKHMRAEILGARQALDDLRRALDQARVERDAARMEVERLGRVSEGAALPLHQQEL